MDLKLAKEHHLNTIMVLVNLAIDAGLLCLVVSRDWTVTGKYATSTHIVSK